MRVRKKLEKTLNISLLDEGSSEPTDSPRQDDYHDGGCHPDQEGEEVIFLIFYA